MVCPYCNTRNQPNATVCASCGIIFAAVKTAPRAPKKPINRKAVLRLIVVVIAAIACGYLGLVWAGKYRFPEQVGLIVSAVLGALLVYGFTAANLLYFRFIYRTKNTALHARVRSALAGAEKRYENALKKQEGGSEARLSLAVAHLLEGELEKSFQEFQQARQLGAANADFFNNAGVALARRGSIAQSVEMFEQAAGQNGQHPQPLSNIAHAFVEVRSAIDPDVKQQVVRKVQETVALDGKNPVIYNRLGLIFGREGRYDDARSQFRRALELAGGSRLAQADAHNNLGITLFGAGNLREANAEFQAALRIDPSHGHALCNQGLLLMQQGRAADAIERMQTAAMLDTKNAAIQSNLGYALCRFGAINDGIRLFREAILLDQNLFEAYYNLGKVYTDAKLPDIAERYLARALQLNPQSWQAQVEMGLIKSLLGQNAFAVQFFQAANELNPNQPVILVNLGISLTLSGDYEKAEELFKQAMAADTQKSEPYANLGWLYLLRDQPDAAQGELQQALHLNDRMPEAHNNFGLCHMTTNEPNLALLHFKRSLALDEEMVRAHYQMGCANILLKLNDSAMREWEIATKHEPGNADLYSNLGVGYYQRVQYDLAVVEFRRVIVIRQHRMEDFSNLALAYSKQGLALRAQSKTPQDIKGKQATEKAKLAVDMFDKALAIEPDNVMLHSNRGLACYFANEPEEAMREWTIVSRLNPLYAQRRGKAQQSEFDDSIINFIPLNIIERAAALPPQGADYLFELLPGYETEEWDMIISDPALVSVPQMLRESQRLERSLNLLKV